MQPWAIHQQTGVSVPADIFASVLREQHARFLQTFGAFSIDRWKHPTRCDGWDAHTVFRHLADAVEMQTAGFTGVVPEFATAMDGFDPRTTPDVWLSQSADESVDATLERFEQASTQLQELAPAAFRAGDETQRDGPYGRAHWSVVTVHVLWDAWLHERDILLVDQSIESTRSFGSSSEQRLVTMYGALMTTVPGVKLGQPLAATITLDQDEADPLHLDLRGDPGAVAAIELSELDQPDLRGDLVPVADAIAGRGSPMRDVLTGPEQLVEAMSLLGQLI